MKIVVISDTHGIPFAHLIPECDLLLHCGDVSHVSESHTHGTQMRFLKNKFIPELAKCPAKRIIFIAGNHDVFLHDLQISNDTRWLRDILPSRVEYLANSYTCVGPYTVYGTPLVPLPKWANAGPPVWNFAIPPGPELRSAYANIPQDTDILMTHGPVYGFADTIAGPAGVVNLATGTVDEDPHLGSKDLAHCLPSGGRLRYVFSGHIHSGNHEKQSSFGVDFYGVSLLDERYKLFYAPLEIDLDYVPLKL